MAAVCALWYFFESAAGTSGLDIVLLIDSSVALGTLLRGCSRQRDWNDIVSGIWFAAADQGHILNIFRAPSHLNVADWPTREERKAKEMQQLTASGFNRVVWTWPSVDFWGA